jgi:uncharacterized protein involved in exopolysaccharide biosynthesis
VTESTLPAITVWDVARVVWKARWPIIALVVIAATTALFYGARLPKVYRTTATVLAPKESGSQSMASSLGSLLGGGGGGGGRDGGGFSFPGISLGPQQSTNLDIFMAVLRSRTMREDVLRDFAKTWGPGVGGMVVGIETGQSKERATLSLTVEATDPKLAADLANAYFDYLDRRLQQNAERDARRQEVLYRAQLERAAKEVDLAEGALVRFQVDNRMLAVDPSTKASTESGGSLRGAIMGLELQREVMRMRYTDQHPLMRDIEKQISESKKQYSKNLFGSAMELPPEGPNAKGTRREFFVSADKMTPTQFAYLKLLRTLKIQEAFYTGALQGLEQMRYQTESGRPQGLDPLDPALVPGGPVRPNVRVIVTAGAIAALVVGMAGALVFEYVRLTMGLDTKKRRRVSVPAGPVTPVDGGRLPANGGVGAPAGAPRVNA